MEAILPGSVVDDDKARTAVVLRRKPCHLDLLADPNHDSRQSVVRHDVVTFTDRQLATGNLKIVKIR